ncbi:Protein of unknown function [Phyllobacterium sp. YR620]|nr:Protein of unknown function [Phyllobacterium sp. YR620]
MGLLLANAGVSAALSNRINWGRKPQSDLGLPYAVLQKISGLPDIHMRAPSGLITSRIQVDIYSETYTAMLAAYRAILALLSGYSGTVSGTNFQGVFLDADRDLPAADAGEVNNLFRKSLDFIIWHD